MPNIVTCGLSKIDVKYRGGMKIYQTILMPISFYGKQYYNHKFYGSSINILIFLYFIKIE